jgi:hypothetical protein
METTQRCASPSVCKTAKYSAIPGTIATTQWCQSQCSDQSDSRYCPCTLCECSDSCGQTIENGDFEQGLKGWNVVRQSGSLGLLTTAEAGSVTPVSSKLVTPLGKQGNKVALFDGASAGSYVLYQEISPRAGDTLFLSWTVSNYKPFSNRPESLAANIKGNQQFRIDIVKPDSTAWFNLDTGNKDVLANVLSPTRVSAVVSALGKPPYSDANAWRHLRYDLDAFAGQKVILAFRSVNSAGVMNVGIDDVRIQNVACGLDKPTFAKTSKPVKMDESGPACGAICQTSF